MLQKKVIYLVKKHLGRSKTKKINTWLNFSHRINHRLIHTDEFIMVILVGALWALMAYGTGLRWTENVELNNKIDASVQEAIVNFWPGWSKIISKWTVWCDVENSFYCGYCAYGAALISEEFFPYVDPNLQLRTRWGNAWDRCDNAQLAGFPIGDEPQDGALMVYEKSKRYSPYGHVAKILFTKPGNKRVVVRDMNYTQRYEMTDRRQDSTDPDIQCYIYPKHKLKPAKIIVNTDIKPLPPVEELIAQIDILDEIVEPIVENVVEPTIEGIVIEPVDAIIEPIIEPTSPIVLNIAG